MQSEELKISEEAFSDFKNILADELASHCRWIVIKLYDYSLALMYRFGQERWHHNIHLSCTKTVAKYLEDATYIQDWYNAQNPTLTAMMQTYGPIKFNTETHPDVFGDWKSRLANGQTVPFRLPVELHEFSNFRAIIFDEVS